MLVCHLIMVESRNGRQGPDPLGKPPPRFGALHASDGGVNMLPGAVTRGMGGRGRTPRRWSIAGSVQPKSVQARPCSGASEGKDTLNLLTSRRSILEPAEPWCEAWPRTSSGDGTYPARHTEATGTSTTGRHARPTMRCPRLPNAHPPDRRGAPRSPGQTRLHAVCCHWGPRQGPRQPLATYGLSARTYCGPRGPVVSCPGQGRPCVAPADTHGDLHGAANAQHAEAVRQLKGVMQCGLPRRDVGTADDVLCHRPHRLRVLWEHMTLAALQLDVALQTVHRHVHATCRLHEVSEEDVGEATVVEDVPDPTNSHGTGVHVFRKSSANCAR